MQVCSPELGTYCCKRDYDCCTNSTLVYALGKPEVVTIIPNHTAHPTHPPASAATHTATPKDGARRSTAYARDTIIGVAVGFAAAMAILIVGCCCWLTKRRPSERYRDRDRKSGVFEMDKMDGSGLAIHKQISASVSQLDTPSPETELDAPTRLELDTRRATIINQVVEMFELDASPSDEERRPDGSLAQGTIREGPAGEENPSPARRASDIPILEASPVLAPRHSRLHPPSSNLPIPEIRMGATATRPVSEFTPIAERVPTPLPDTPEPESSNDMPPIPASPPATSLPEIMTARTLYVERPSPAKSYDVSRKSETTPHQGSQIGGEDLTRLGPSGPSPGSSILETVTIDVSRMPETTSSEQFEAGPSTKRPFLETSASQTHQMETDIPEKLSLAGSNTPEEVTGESEPQLAASATEALPSETEASQIPLPEQPAPEQPTTPKPAPEKPAPEPASKPD